jgi:hypothetical protein
MVQSFGQVSWDPKGPLGILLTGHSHSMVQPGFIHAIKGFCPTDEGRKKVEGNKRGRYEDKEIFIGFFFNPG